MRPSNHESKTGEISRVAVITGASAGVGRAIAHRFARGGWRLGLIAREAAALNVVRREVEELGGEAMVAPADVSDANALFKASDEIAKHFGKIDVWINDAMVTVFSPVSQITPEEYRRVTEVTYLGFVHGTMAALRHMRFANRGHIIQVGSALAYRGIPLQAEYCGAKHAIRGFTDSLRCELIAERSSINITVVELPAVNTPQFAWARTHMPRQPRPVAPVFEPEAIARAVYRAVQRPRREYWIGWSTIKVIRANSVLPAFSDRYLAEIAIEGQETELAVLPDRSDNLYQPVFGHKTSGSFGREAKGSAFSVSGTSARASAIILGCVAFFMVGFWVGTLKQDVY